MELRAKQITEICGISQKLLSAWIDRGFVRPGVRAKGSGTRHIFAETDALRIMLFKRLGEAGFPRDKAAGVAFKADKDPGIQMLFTAYRDFQRYDEGRRKAKTLLSRPARPAPVFLALVQHDEGSVGYPVVDFRGFGRLYDQLEKSEIAVIVNLSEIAARAWEIIKGLAA
jgi:DNA-binding transcriptional MerR regulator